MKKALSDSRLYFVLVISFLLLTSWLPFSLFEELEAKLEAFNKKFPKVKLHVLTNQPEYAPGDTIHFTSWYLNENNQPVYGYHIATLELVDYSGKSVLKTLYKIKNGIGSNQLILKPELPSGDYLLVGYTNWMRNFGNELLYKRSIHLLSKSDLIKQQSNALNFSAEGGTLVRGVKNKVAVMGPAMAHVEIFSNQSDSLLSQFTLDSTGLGTFTFVPTSTESYQGRIRGAEKKWRVGKAQEDGIALAVECNESLKISLSSPANSSLRNSELYLVVASQWKITDKRRITLSSDETLSVQIPINTKQHAAHQVFVFNGQGKILAYRIFIPQKPRKISVNLVAPSIVGQRDKVNGTIQLLDEYGNLVDGDMNITVVQSELFKSNPIKNNTINLLDFPDAMAWVEQNNLADINSVNDYLITQQGQRTAWEQFLSGTKNNFSYSFSSPVAFSGEIKSKTTGLPPPDSTLVMSYFQKNAMGVESYTKGGKFLVPFVADFWGEDEIFCTLLSKGKSLDADYTIIPASDTLSGIFASKTLPIAGKESVYGQYSINRTIAAKSYGFFAVAKTNTEIKSENPNQLIEEELGGADLSIKVDDYVVFPSMEELIHEIVPNVQVKKKGELKGLRMSFRYDGKIKNYYHDPVYIIDGIVTKNTALFFDLKPSDLNFIKIINNPNKLVRLGKLGENGVIFVQTKKGLYDHDLIHHHHFFITGLNSVTTKESVNIAASGAINRIPDLRSTLYWNPLINTEKARIATYEFLASDDIGPIKIIVRGITRSGQLFYKEATVAVTFKMN